MWLRQFAYLAALLLTQPAMAAVAPVEKYQPGNIIVAIEGGLVGEELGAVVLALAKGETLIGTRPYIVGPGDTPCLMAGREINIPRPCSAQFLKALDLLNPKLRPSSGRLSVGQTILLPDVWVRSYRTARTFSNAIPHEQARAATIQRSWSHLRTGTAKSPRSEQIEFDAYELILGNNDADRQQKLMERLTPFRSLNVRVTAIGFRAAAAKAYSTTPALYQRDCSLTPPTPPKVDYQAYADVDGDLKSIVGTRPPGARPAKVILIDVKLILSPNLAGAVEGATGDPPASTGRCAWIGAASVQQHATHLAGIIASRDNGSGFVGLSPSSIIVPYELLQPDATAESGLSIPPGRNEWLADMIGENRSLPEPHLYLIAASLPEYQAELINRFGQIDKRVRFDDLRQVERRIDQLRPLFVVAAGQTDRPVALSPTTPISPQNLGDLRNVLVVTACEDCTRHDAHLMPDANFGTDGRYVHVAAPGGAPMVGWLDGVGVGEAHGTSQAAAYTAGVIAEMIGRWSDSYRDADLVKKRIQTTAWPIYKRPGHTDDDYNRLATGIVDPALALLNPRVHWIKDANGWREIQLKGFSSPALSFRGGGGSEVLVPAKSVARFVRISQSGQPGRWIVYTDMAKRDSIDRLGDVQRDGPLEPPADVTLLPCQGPPIPLSEIDDLVIANAGFGPAACGP
ncbi:S8 family serine peptidase [Sphingomonas sp. 1P06PA]|uniref:S8 family serine peptidase n=1 Tax=Sphingomonas sp. 1P06PA TaxID=554121 RepID=UPI0039A4A4CC